MNKIIPSPELENWGKSSRLKLKKIEELSELFEQSGSDQTRFQTEYRRLIEDLNTLLDLNREGQAISSDFQEDFEQQLVNFQNEWQFDRKYDNYPVVLTIYAGVGGLDAQDWTRLLSRIYQKWAESNNLRLKLVSQTATTNNGFKNISWQISGRRQLYRLLKLESGVHRLVRRSPFNSQNKRQTSFATVEVVPLIDQPTDYPLLESEIRVDYFAASGPGGQSVNTTDSAVRITHLPTKTVVSIQNERSQQQNRRLAETILRSKLIELKLEKYRLLLDRLKGKTANTQWGSQIRNYIFDPYQLVKDLRSGCSTTQINKVFDGQIDDFLKESLNWQKKHYNK